jgi:hypothetical protein
MMKIYARDNSELMQVTALEQDGSALVMKGKVFGSMPMLTPQEARNALKLLNFKLVMFLFTFLFRK